MPALSGSEVDALGLLLSTTLSFSDLETIVYASTGDQLYEAYVGRGEPLRPTIRKLLIELEKLGVTERFLGAVHLRRPQRADVRVAIEQLFPGASGNSSEGGMALSLQHQGVATADAPQRAAAPGLQRNVRPHLHRVDVRVWLEKLADVEGRVCRIERDGAAQGTGFLVGAECVLTNWHVAGEAAPGSGGALSCHFDFVRLAGGALGAGISVPVAGVIDSSPCSPAELTPTPETPPPTTDELDYALLRLAEPIGAADRNGKPRGWIPLPQGPLTVAAGAPILIVQHPLGAPMKLALDTDAVIGRIPNDTRLRYRTNTESGSSGAPCFDMDWDLLALHHFGDPAWREPLFNQGVPAELIRGRLASRGHTGWLGN